MKRGAIIVLTLHFGLHLLIQQVNHSLTLLPLNLSLFIGGIFVVLPILRLSENEGLVIVFLSGLIIDSQAPTWFGLHAMVLALVYTAARPLSRRSVLPEQGTALLIALGGNLAAFIGLSVLMPFFYPTAGAQVWLRHFLTVLASEGALLLLTPWLLACERQLRIRWIPSRTAHRGLG